jgi:hypothetical protein
MCDVGGGVAQHTCPGLGGGKGARGKLSRRKHDACGGVIWDQAHCNLHHQLVVVSQQLLDRPPCKLYGLQQKSCQQPYQMVRAALHVSVPKPALAAGTLNTAHELHTLVRHVCQADVSMSHSEGTWTHLCNGFTDVIKNDGAGEPIDRCFPWLPRPHGAVCQQDRSYFHVVEPLHGRPSHASPGQRTSAPACCHEVSGPGLQVHVRCVHVLCITFAQSCSMTAAACHAGSSASLASRCAAEVAPQIASSAACKMAVCMQQTQHRRGVSGGVY